MSWRFKDTDISGPGACRAGICHLFDDDGHGLFLGWVWISGASEWRWEAEGADYDDPEDPGHGVEDTRRAAKAALRKCLKSVETVAKSTDGTSKDPIGEEGEAEHEHSS